jgi:hypothetical protein
MRYAGFALGFAIKSKNGGNNINGEISRDLPRDLL